MTPRQPSPDLARRELLLAAVVLVSMARLAGRHDVLPLIVLVAAAVVVAGWWIVGRDVARGRAVEAFLVPAVLAGGSASAIQLVPLGLGLVPALAAFALVFDRAVRLELRLLEQPGGVTEGDRSHVLLFAVLASFVAFTGVAVGVPGGLAEPGTRAGSLPEGWLVVLAVEDALVGLVLGYRMASLRYGTARDAARSAVTYAILVAVVAGALRAANVWLLIAPAVLTVVFYLWDAFQGAAPARRRDPRFLWETALLVALGLVVVYWNLQLRG